jgi:hypothetical protein
MSSALLDSLWLLAALLFCLLVLALVDVLVVDLRELLRQRRAKRRVFAEKANPPST